MQSCSSENTFTAEWHNPCQPPPSPIFLKAFSMCYVTFSDPPLIIGPFLKNGLFTDFKVSIESSTEIKWTVRKIFKIYSIGKAISLHR